MRSMKPERIMTAAGARVLLEREFFKKGMTSDDIKLLDRVQEYITRAFNDGYNMATGAEEWSNNACLGYAILGATELKYKPEQVQKLVRAIYSTFDERTVGEAKQAYENSPY